MLWKRRSIMYQSDLPVNVSRGWSSLGLFLWRLTDTGLWWWFLWLGFHPRTQEKRMIGDSHEVLWSFWDGVRIHFKTSWPFLDERPHGHRYMMTCNVISHICLMMKNNCTNSIHCQAYHWRQLTQGWPLPSFGRHLSPSEVMDPWWYSQCLWKWVNLLTPMTNKNVNWKHAS